MTNLTHEGKATLVSGIAFTVLASIAVGLRILSKAYTKTSWAADDSWAVLGLVALFALATAEIWGMLYLYHKAILDHVKQPLIKAGVYAGGGGLSIEKILLQNQSATLENYVKANSSTGPHRLAIAHSKLQSLYMLSPLYGLSTTAIKLSILYLYRRIFAVKPFKQMSFAVAAACVIWWVVFTVTALVPCLPVKKFWQYRIEGQCYNFNTFFIWAGVVDVLLDGIILALPIRVISRLQMPYKRKGSFGPTATSALQFCALASLLTLLSYRRPSEKETDDYPLKHYDKIAEPVGEGQFSGETARGTSTSVHKDNEWEMDRTEMENTAHMV
ncbi:MAG: hypothetical protein Q9178_003783 [Gyalolechia marmorata]